MSAQEVILNSASEYVTWDPNEETKAQIASYAAEMNITKLSGVLSSRLEFGTAGLRGPMGAGYNRMNDLVLMQTSQGICRYLIDQLGEEAKSKGIVIGYDHRKLGTLTSLGFARMCAAVFLSQGFKVYLLEGFVPTPFVAFAVSHLDCAAGFMVTASHNPKADNGLKVYWGNGAQIIPPHDTGMAQAIISNLEPWQKYDVDNVLQHPNADNATVRIADAYYSAVSRLIDPIRAQKNKSSPLRVVYTAMHGVGSQWVKRAFEVSGHNPFISVLSQSEPDPEFRTVDFPNPEEKGALNESIKCANKNNISLIIANDPDADRLAAAEVIGISDADTDTDPGPMIPEWHLFTGNELGVLLGYWLIKKWNEQEAIEKSGKRAAVLASVVSSRMLRTIALAEGVEYYDTLTGFKWIGNRALELKSEGVQVLFSYEEALGYCVGDLVPDKDGISAAVVFVDMARELNDIGYTVRTLLQTIQQKYGNFVSYNSYLLSHDGNITNNIFNRLRKAGPQGGYFDSCGGVKIKSIKDVTFGYDSSDINGKSDLPMTSNSHMIMYEFENGCSVTLRTSGTEPKIKFYTEIAGNPLESRSKEDLEIVLKSFVDVVIQEMLQPTLNKLIPSI